MEDKLNEYISVTKAFGENKIYWNPSIFSQILLNNVANAVDLADKKVKRKKQQEARID